MGTASLVLGIIGVVFSWTLIFGFIPGILAVIFGSIGRARAKRGEATNRGMATAGLVLGAIALVIVVVFFAALVAGGGHYCFHAGTDPNPCPS